MTGGLGTIGRPLVRHLEKCGHEVWICDLMHSDRPQYFRCDVANYRELQRVVCRGFDIVYHLAAEFGRHNGEDFFDRLWATNAVGTKNILLLQEEIRYRLVFFSSSEVYGDYSDVMTEEVVDTTPIRHMNDYAMSKWVGEVQVMNSADRHQTESVRVRLFNVYGPGEYYSPYRSANCVFCYKAIMGLPYTVFTDHHRTSLYIDDAVKTLANIVGEFRPGAVYNIGGSEYHDMRKISGLALQSVGRDDSKVKYTKSQPWTTRDKRVDTTKAQIELRHDPNVSLEDGIRRTVEWMKMAYANVEIGYANKTK